MNIYSIGMKFFVTLWTVTCQAPLSMGFSWQEYWSGLPCPPPGGLPNPETEPFCVSWLVKWVFGLFVCLFVYHTATWEVQLPFITIQYIHFVHIPTNFPFDNPLCPLYLDFVSLFVLFIIFKPTNEWNNIFSIYFSFWLFSLNILRSRSIHVFSNGKVSLFYSWAVFHCMYKMHLL